MRAHMPAAIRRRLEVVERRMAGKAKPAVSIAYNVAKPVAATAAPAASSDGSPVLAASPGAEALPPVGASE
jgi:hypothetical protein